MFDLTCKCHPAYDLLNSLPPIYIGLRLFVPAQRQTCEHLVPRMSHLQAMIMFFVEAPDAGLSAASCGWALSEVLCLRHEVNWDGQFSRCVVY